MKRIIISLLAICLSVFANAQIQTKFWGLNMSEHYSSVESARQVIADRCEYSEVEDDKINAMGGKFGGHYWSFIDFSFYGILYYKVCYYVRFSNQSKSRDIIKSQFESLARALTDKYGTPPITKDEYNEVVNMWVEQDSPYSCMLEMEKGMSRGGEEYWYINLSYCDHDYLELALDEDESEL